MAVHLRPSGLYSRPTQPSATQQKLQENVLFESKTSAQDNCVRVRQDRAQKGGKSNKNKKKEKEKKS